MDRLLESSRPIRHTMARRRAMAGPPGINILLLGETQSGKSTFIETVKKYANPDYTINLNNIGGSVSSCTEDVIRSTVRTNLPIAKVAKNTPVSSPTAINLGSLIHDSPDVDDFEDALNQRDFRIVQVPSSKSRKEYQFNLFDTPGLNDTHGKDEEHTVSIYKALQDAGNIHLVLVTIGNVPFSPSFQAAIKCYFDMFPEFHGLLAFVHTHFDYKNLHPKREDIFSRHTEKKDALNKMMGRNTCQHFEIDCDIKSTRPIRIGITQNIIRKILSLAPFNQPVIMNKALVLKSPKMKDMDNIIADKYKAVLDAQRATLDFKDGAQGDILRNLYEMESRLNSLRSEEWDLEGYIKEYNTSDLVMIHESAFEEQWRFFQLNKDHSMDFPVQEHIIHKKNVLNENVDISKEQGGEGHNYWNIVYKRDNYKDGTLHAKLYTTRSSIYSKEISERESKLSRLRSDLQRAEQEHFQYSSEHQSEMADIRELVEKNALYVRLISRLSSERLSPEAFQYLVDVKAYSSWNSETVENAYIEIIRKDEERSLHQEAIHVIPGVQSEITWKGEMELSHRQEATHIIPEVQEIKVFNVLVLGETRFGKSTFVEFVKKYADTDYILDFGTIANTISSCTKEVIRSTVHTDLLVSDVVENISGSNPTEVYLGSIINDSPDFSSFEGALDQRNLKIIRTQSSESPRQYQFNLFSAPNDTLRENEARIASVFQTLRRAKDISLVMVTVGTTPFPPGFQDTTRCYFDKFPELHGLTAFVHTDVHYRDFHPSRIKAVSRLAAKIRLLNDMMGRDSCPHFAIDCDLKTSRPVRDCITQNTIHNILYLASSSKPVVVNLDLQVA